MDAPPPAVSAVKAGVMCACPRCGAGALFRGPLTLTINAACPRCRLSFAFADSGDGPAVFVIMILGFVGPPLWVHMVVWPVVTLGAGWALLRVMKATLIALQFKHKAEEGRLAKD
jgi:uncharacterized protein (DUF983 family)